MSGTLTGTQDQTFAVHSASEASVTFSRDGAGSIQLIGFTKEDDAIGAEPTVDTVSYTGGLYGGISANIDMTRLGTLTLKLKSSSADNGRLAAWHRETQAGRIDPATFIISSSNFRHTAKFCLVQKPASPGPASAEDPSAEWLILVGILDLWIPIDTGT